jgi:hypothetical protein
VANLTAQIGASIQWSASSDLTGALGSLVQAGQMQKRISYTTGNGTSQANLAYAAQLSLGNSANTTIDLTAIIDVLTANGTFARAKAVMFYLPSTADDSTNGCDARSVLFGNATANQAFTDATNGFLAGTNPQVRVMNGGFAAFGVGNATGSNVSASLKNLKVTNEDSGNTAKPYVIILGANV